MKEPEHEGMSDAGSRTAPPPTVVLACDFFLKYTLGLAEGLHDAGCRVTIVGREHAGEFGGDLSALRSHLGRRLPPGTELRLLRGRVRDVRGLRQAVGAAAGGRQSRPRVVHLQDGVVNDPRLLVAVRARPGAFALTVHDPVTHPGDPTPDARKRLVRAALLRSAAVVFVHGEALREELQAHRDLRTPIEVIPHGADPSTVAPLPTQPCLLFFGRVSHYKGVDVLLDAMPTIWASLPETRLVVAGQGKLPEHSVLGDPRVLVRNEHVAEAELPSLFADATVAVLPYRQASQSGVGSQAKTYGRAILTTEVGGLPELVSDGSGLVVAPERPDELARAAIRLLEDGELARRLGAAGARTVDSEASWGSVGRRTLRAYRRHGLLQTEPLPGLGDGLGLSQAGTFL